MELDRKRIESERVMVLREEREELFDEVKEILHR